jgi:predicted dehydrogenase
MRTLNIAMIGTGFMGKAHALAYAAMPFYFTPPPAMPVRKVVVDVNDDLASAARQRLLFEEHATGWQDVVTRDDIDIVDICTPNDSHAEIAIAAARAGKHILCEKPLARSTAEAKGMLDAVTAARVTHMVAFNYRHTPAVLMAKKLIDEGRIGEVLTFRGHYLQDWSADPGAALSWRFQQKVAGSGTLGDIGTHILDMGRYLLGEIEAVQAVAKTFIPERPLQTGAFDRLASGDRSTGGPKGKVDVDDYVLTMLRFTSGVVGSIEASRNAWGRHNFLGFEIHGRRGSLIFDFQRMNELQLTLADEPAELTGLRTVFTGPAHPYGENLWPVPCLGIGYVDVKVIECFNFIEAVVAGREASPSFADGYQICRITDAILASAESRRWETVEQPDRG